MTVGSIEFTSTSFLDEGFEWLHHPELPNTYVQTTLPTTPASSPTLTTVVPADPTHLSAAPTISSVDPAVETTLPTQPISTQPPVAAVSIDDEEQQKRQQVGKIIEISFQRLILQPPAYRDFWSKTFYTPLLIKADACAYVRHIPAEKEMTMEVEMSYTPIVQFDQAGLMIYIDDNHWMKCGIEFCDGHTRLSVVVTNNGFSDWSTQSWPDYTVRLKVHKVQQSSSIVIEAAPVVGQHIYTSDAAPMATSSTHHQAHANKFQFIRIAHLQSNQSSNKDWLVGPFAACPTQQQGCIATFTNWKLGPRQSSCHDPDLAIHNL